MKAAVASIYKDTTNILGTYKTRCYLPPPSLLIGVLYTHYKRLFSFFHFFFFKADPFSADGVHHGGPSVAAPDSRDLP